MTTSATRRASPLLNYSTAVEVDVTIGQIHGILRAHRARAITDEYDADGEAVAVHFVYATDYGDREFRLPINVEGVQQLLVDKTRAGEIQPPHARGWTRERFTSRQHAARVAWRIVKDWVEAQMAIVASRQVRLEQVMFPYMLASDPENLSRQVSVFEAYERGEQKRLGSGRGD